MQSDFKSFWVNICWNEILIIILNYLNNSAKLLTCILLNVALEATWNNFFRRGPNYSKTKIKTPLIGHNKDGIIDIIFVTFDSYSKLLQLH